MKKIKNYEQFINESVNEAFTITLEQLPKIGDIVTFKYYDLTKNNKPKFASFLRIRNKE